MEPRTRLFKLCTEDMGSGSILAFAPIRTRAVDLRLNSRAMDQLAELLGRSPAIEAVRSHIKRLASSAFRAPRPPAVLIQGETGTGKGLLARLLHRISPRAEGPFVAINCAAIPEPLMEALLFGHERGAYTSADRARVGLLQSGNRGVVFLDEIGLMPIALQAKLLVAIEEGYIRRVGSTLAEPLDVWVISASNVDLGPATQEGRFREDLYHRLARLTITLPPLRARGADVELLAEAFLARACEEYVLPRKVLTPEARRRLRAYSWPGNIRELANVVERAALMAEGAEIVGEALNLEERESAVAPSRLGSASDGESLKDRHQRVLDETGGNISRTAERLGISRNTLRARIKRWDLRVASHTEHPPHTAKEPSAVAKEATSGGVQPSSPELAPTPPPWMPPHIRWERRSVTTLAVVLASPSEMQPFELARLLHDLIAKARSFGGCIEELTPTSFLVAFGDSPVEDAPACAAQAARAILKTVERRLEAEVPAVTAALGIHARWCLTAFSGDTRGIDAGDRRAIREALDELTALAQPGEILVSGDARPLLQRRFVLEPAGDAVLVGACYRLSPGERTGFEVGGRVRSPLVGREKELVTLHELLARAKEGRGQVVGIVGDPGIGKSRLVQEFRQSLAREVTWLEGRCVSYRSTTPYHPIVDIVRGNFGVSESDPAEVVTERLRGGLEALELAAEETAPYLLHLLGIKAGTERLGGLTPEAIRTRTMEALRQLALRGSQRRPIVFVVEDLQWVDQTSADALAALAESLHACPLMLVTTYRPGYQPPWLGRSYATQLAVQRLTREDSLAIVRAVAAGSELPEETAHAVLDQAEGVPLFLEELARAVVEDARLRSGLSIPGTVHGVIASRLDRLPAEDRDVLQVAAVTGGDVSMSVLASVSGLEEADLTRCLDHLQAAEFVHEIATGATRRYTFKHTLIQEVAYQSLPDDRRRTLHVRAAEALERLFPDAAERAPEVLGHHYTQAERRPQAIGFWLRAGQRAVHRSANAEAIAHLSKGLDLLAALPESDERVRQELTFQMAIGVPLAITRGYGASEVERVLTRARYLCQCAGDSPQLFPVCFGLWRFYVARADFPTAEEMADQLLRLAMRRHEPELAIAADLAAGVPRFYKGALQQAREHFERATKHHSVEHSAAQVLAYGQDLGVGAWAFLGWTLGLLGYLDQATAAVDRSVELARATAHPFSLALALHLAGMVGHLRGEPVIAGRVGEEELELSREQGFPFFLAGGLGFTGWAQVCRGDLEGGLALMREGASVYRTTGADVGIAHLAHLAEALVDTGFIEEGLGVVASALDKVERTGECAYAAEFHRIKGLAHLRSAPRDPEKAVACFRAALSVAQGQTARTLELQAALALAKLAVSEGRASEAREVLAPLDAWFKEGETCRDVRAARELLRAAA